MKVENINLNEIMTSEQANEQGLSDIFAYHQPLETSQNDTKICVVHKNRENISWTSAGDGLRETIKCLKEDNNSDCWVSISEFRSEKLNENYVASIKIFYIRLRKTEKFNPSTQNEGKNIILEYCREREIPTPSLIIYDGNEYCLKWILREPLNDYHSLKLWKTVQRFLSERFFCILDDRYYLDDRNSPKNRFIEAHSDATAMLRVSGFLNSQTKGADLFNPKQEVQVIFNSGITYITSEIAIKLHLSVCEIEQYRDAKEWAKGYLHKKISSPVSRVRIIFDFDTNKESGEEIMNNYNTKIIETALRKHHKTREEETFIYVKRKNIEKCSRTDRQCFYDSYSVSELERFLGRTDINDCDFWATAAEYTWDFRKIKEKKIFRTKENGERYEEIRRQLPKREKWIEAIQLNFLHLNFRKSEFGYIPTTEQAKDLIYARCDELKLPKPVIVDTGDNGEKLELRWTWQNAMKNCGERDNKRIKYPKFNRKFDAMQRELFRLLVLMIRN